MRATGGSIIPFILVGVVLLAGLGGGVYYLSHRDDGPPPEEVAQQPAQESEPNGATGEPEDSAVLGGPDGSDQPREDENAGAESRQSQPAGGDGQPATAQALPQTGPADSWLTAAAMASLTFATTAFAGSRRAARR